MPPTVKLGTMRSSSQHIAPGDSCRPDSSKLLRRGRPSSSPGPAEPNNHALWCVCGFQVRKIVAVLSSILLLISVQLAIIVTPALTKKADSRRSQDEPLCDAYVPDIFFRLSAGE
jgi:hypothetical protein